MLFFIDSRYTIYINSNISNATGIATKIKTLKIKFSTIEMIRKGLMKIETWFANKWKLQCVYFSVKYTQREHVYREIYNKNVNLTKKMTLIWSVYTNFSQIFKIIHFQVNNSVRMLALQMYIQYSYRYFIPDPEDSCTVIRKQMCALYIVFVFVYIK